MKKENTVIVALAVLAAVIAATWLLLVAPAYTGNEINMPKGVTQFLILSFMKMIRSTILRILKIC